ncbi:MAG: PD-(D/E)XK nuclease family protein [Verrucomicrobia bacterium]|nr:PD-(D/E)XK nuclease family protein [Verrucomicrobiota bacterium]
MTPPREPVIKDVLDELLQTVSPTRLNCWLQCRLKFWFHYVLRLRRASKSSLHVGNVVHSVLQAWNLTRWRQKAVDVEALKDTFQQSWQESQAGQGINWGNEEPKQQTATWALLEAYFQKTPITMNERPEAVEALVEADLTLHGLPKLVGVIDLVRAGRRIVDYKTTKQTPTSKKADHLNETQTSSYAVMYRAATGRKESGIEIHHLVKLKKPKIVITPFEPMTDNQQSRLFRIIESYVAGLDREDFVPSPGLLCHSCEYFDECRKWCG